MASKLLDTLQKIENDRQSAIMIANAQGYKLPNNASFTQIAATAGTQDHFAGIQQGALNTEDWSRPEEWPDCYSILRQAGNRTDSIINKEVEPVGIYLLKDGEDTITFWRKQSSTASDKGDQQYIYGDAFLLSDGTWVEGLSKLASGATTQHTWDVTKDIIVSSGKYPGRYRWLIEYRVVSNSTTLSDIGHVKFWPVVEVLSLKTCPGIGSKAYAQSLLSFEILPESPLRSIRHSSFNFPIFSQLINLRNLILTPITSMTIRYGFRSLHRLRKLDLSHLDRMIYDYDDEIGLEYALSLEEFIGPKSITHSSSTTTTRHVVTFKQLPVIKRLILPEDVYLDCDSTSVLNADCEIQCAGFMDYRPRNYEQRLLTTEQRNTLPGSSSYGYETFLDVIDFSNYECSTTHTYSVFSTSGSVLAVSGIFCKSFIIPHDCHYRLNISSLYYLSKEGIINVFNRLMDLTNSEFSVTSPTIQLSDYQKGLLTDADIAIVTNKGWEVK